MSIYYEDKLLSDINYIYADTCFFQTFGIPVLKGNPKDMIMPGSVFVSEHFARETFGDADPIGKILKADRQNDFTIRGVYRDVPENTMLTHDLVVSIHRDGGYQGGNGWKGNDFFYTFLRLRDAADIDKVNDKIQRVIEKYTPARFSTTWTASPTGPPWRSTTPTRRSSSSRSTRAWNRSSTRSW